jgi:hypothetical protein
MADGAESWAEHLPRELVGKFAAARKRVRRVILAKGWTLVLTVACVSFAVSIVLDRLFFLRSQFRFALFVTGLSMVGLFLLVFLVIPLLRRISARRIAQSLEDKHPRLGDMLLSAVELSEQLAAGETYTSRQLVEAVSEETSRRTKGIDFRSVLPFSTIRRPLLITLAVACGLAVYCYFRPMIAENVLQRLLFPYSGPPPLTFTQLTVSPGDALVPTGTDVEIRAATAGKIPQKALVYLKGKDGRWNKQVLAKQAGGEFRYLLKGLINPLIYKVKAGDARSGTYRISVSDTPVIVGIEVDYSYPDYTKRKPERKSGDGDIAAVKGSEVKITARANKPLKSAKLRFGGGTYSLVSIRADGAIQSQVFNVTEDDTYSFDLVDTDGFTNQEAITHTIKAIEDRKPVVGIRSPEKYSEATLDEVVDVTFRAVDDFGIEKVWLEYTVSSGEVKEEKDKVPGEERKGTLPLRVGQNGKVEIEGGYSLSMADLAPKVGEVVVFRIVAEDNNILSGPSQGASSDHTIRIISNESSFRKIEQEQQDLTRRLLKLIAQQKENKKQVEELTERLKGKESPSSGEQRSLEEAKSAQQQIEESGRQLAKDFAEMLEKMRQNPMIQMRSVIEMADITGALSGVSANEMPEATKKASEAATSEEAKDRERKLGDTAALQEEIIRKLEEANREFAKLQEEQKVLSLAETADQLAREQLAVRSETGKALPDLSGVFPEKLTEEQKRRLRKLVDGEEKLREKLTEFEERLRTLSKQLEYAKSPDAQTIQSALKYFEPRQGVEADSSSIPQTVREAIESLRANHLNKGISEQSQVYESLLRLAQEFRDAQKARFQGEFTNTAASLQFRESEIDKLIELQKAVIDRTDQLPREKVEGGGLREFEAASDSQKDLLRRTTNYRQILEEIFERLVLIGIDPVPPLKGAEKAMGEASGSLEKLKPDTALGQEKESLANLEKARDELAKALARMMDSANLQQAMQSMSALEKMLQEQRKINDGTTNLDKEASEAKQMTDPMLELLRQLADQQTGLKDRAVAMRDYLKMMLKAGEMMGESATMLRNRQTGQPTQALQGQILELLMQMLVALQMQANQMAQAMGVYGTAGTGAHGGVVTEPIVRPVPESLDDRWSKLPPRVKQELLEAWTEKFSPEFRELIALYYKRLSGEGSLP